MMPLGIVAGALGETEPLLPIGTLPTVYINTDGGAPIVDTENYVPATMILATLEEPNVRKRLRIRGRGNYTWLLPKKPYRLNFDQAYAPLGLTAVQRNWALLANHDDPRKIAYATAWMLGQQMDGLVWTPEFRPVEVVLNDDYVGLYLLSDLVRVEDDRVPGEQVDDDGANGRSGTWLAEISVRATAELVPHFITGQGVVVQYEDPEEELIPSYFAEWIENFEDTLYGPDWLDPVHGYARHIEMEAFVDWWLMNDFGSNQDSGFESSVKLWKERDSLGGKLRLGPLWDFSISFGNAVNTPHPTTGWYTIPNASWVYRMLADPAFRALAATRWTELKSHLAGIYTAQDDLIADQATAMLRDEARWGLAHTDPEDGVTFTQNWMEARRAWIDANLPLLTGGPGDSGIPAIPDSPAITDIDGTGATFSWAAVAGADSYEYQLNYGLPVSVGTALSVRLSVPGGSTNNVRVRAVDAGQPGGYTASVEFTTPDLGPGHWEPVATNYVTNPSLEYPNASFMEEGQNVPGFMSGVSAKDGSKIVGFGGASGDGANKSWNGDNGAIRMGIEPGKTYTFSHWYLQDTLDSGSYERRRGITVHYHQASGYTIFMSPTLPNVVNTWNRAVVTVDFPLDIDMAFVRSYGADSSGVTNLFDCFMMNEGETVHDWFSGDTPDTATERYSWLGTVGASPSLKEIWVAD